MPLSMYTLSIPPVLRSLSNLRALLDKAAAHAEANKIDPLALTSFRLYPDMLPLRSQVQIACDVAKGCAARLSGVDAPKFDDNEHTFAELQARIDKTVDFIGSVKAEQIDGTETKPIVLKTPFGERHFEGLGFAQSFVLPNVYFHCATAYNILRHNGVVLGKLDFLGRS